jgi:hypothetical protein
MGQSWFRRSRTESSWLATRLMMDLWWIGIVKGNPATGTNEAKQELNADRIAKMYPE